MQTHEQPNGSDRDSRFPAYTYGEPQWHLIPEHMRGPLRRYIENGIQPGGFLLAVLCNDLMDACLRADATNINRLPDYVNFLYNSAPPPCFGARERVAKWIANGGLGWKEVCRD